MPPPRGAEGGPSAPGEVYPSERWRHALSWWWVAELVRRHPELAVWEHVANRGRYDTLVVARPVEGRLERRLEIDRNGSIHVPGREIPMIDGPWGELFDADDPHGLIHRLESAAGLGHARPAPPEPGTVGLRLVAAVLMAKVHEQDSWTCRMVAARGDGLALSQPDLEQTFSRLATSPAEASEPGRCWVLLAGETPAALVDLAGEVQLVGADPVPVMAAYDAHEGRLIPTMAALFGPLL